MALRDDVVEAALQALADQRYDRTRAPDLVPARPGLYALYGDEVAWLDLGLEPVCIRQPLYVGKAERSLEGRDVRTHFVSGKTGSSTVRRSLAALLHEALDLVAVPRNLHSPDGSANFALDPPGDARLTTWMERHLRLVTWVRPEGVVLGEIETAVVLRLRPPLNLDKVGEPRDRLRQARRRLAQEARAWSPSFRAPRT